VGNTSWQRVELGGGDGGVTAINLVVPGIGELGHLFDGRTSSRWALAGGHDFMLSIDGGVSSPWQ
jgi:hypothetical protein